MRCIFQEKTAFHIFLIATDLIDRWSELTVFGKVVKILERIGACLLLLICSPFILIFGSGDVFDKYVCLWFKRKMYKDGGEG